MIIIQCAINIILSLFVLYLLIVQWVFWEQIHRKPMDESKLKEVPNVEELVPFYDDGKTGGSRRYIEQARKETAKDYHDKVEEEIEFHNFESTTDYEYMNVCNKEILKEYGVEVEE